ncbi:hypothetical protein TH25_05895 [Thalassospira profundimaris]|uniref:Uncharacterized protein n=1 Tax=Thalassospira profundimaris TaxID=502049 RepID=A0A367XGM5_9PROT|nr:hypothetical protein [Thalassospira profundimaris]RCK52569.1 hypothetical protein TH25_05895 [Thalassospira profundimaris]
MLNTRTRDLLKDLRGWSVDDDDHEFLFNREDWQFEAADLTFPELVLDRSFHFFGLSEDDLPVDVAQRRPVANWYAERDGYIALGIRLIAFVLNDSPCLSVSLSHGESRISHVYFYKRAPMHVSPLLTHEPVRFTSYLYIPESVDRQTFSCSDPAHSELTRPETLVTSFAWSDQIQTYQQTATPDALVIAATPQRLADLGAFLIDFGRDETALTEFAMESALDGAGGILHGSVEQKFWLPGGLDFPERCLDDLSLPKR